MRSGRVTAVFPQAAYIEVDDHILSLVNADAHRLPNSVVLGPAAGLPALRDSGVVVGRGTLLFSTAEVRITRSFDPVPRLRPTTAWSLGQRTRACPTAPTVGLVGNAAETALALEVAVRALQCRAAVDAAAGLVGAGVGLTPAGDDLLAGLLAGLELLPSVITADRRWHPADALATSLRHTVLAHRAATTGLSGALLEHASRGEVGDQVAGLLHALCGAGPVGQAHRALVAVGHTSGSQLAAGVLLAAETVATHARPARSPASTR
jgi:hypothetical protein